MSIIAQIVLDYDDELIKRKRKVKRSIPNFYMIGNGKMNKHRIQAIDLLNEVMTLSKAGQYTFRMIKDMLVYDNEDGEVCVDLSGLTPTYATLFKKGFKELNLRDLVRRTKRSHYMINPNALIPADYDKAMELWIKSPSAVLVS